LRLRAFPLALLLSLVISVPARLSAQKSATALLHGTVTDPSTGTVGYAAVLIGSGGQQIVVNTRTDGTYQKKVSPRIYSLRVESPGFCDGVRGEFFAHAGDDIRFDFVLMPGTISDVYTLGPGGATQHDELKGCYKEEELDRVSPDGLRPMVLFGERRTDGNAERYSSFSRGNGDHHFATYMYDRTTITANEIVYSPKDHLIRAIGRASWLDGDKAQAADEIDVSFAHGQPQVKFGE